MDREGIIECPPCLIPTYIKISPHLSTIEQHHDIAIRRCKAEEVPPVPKFRLLHWVLRHSFLQIHAQIPAQGAKTQLEPGWKGTSKLILGHVHSVVLKIRGWCSWCSKFKGGSFQSCGNPTETGPLLGKEQVLCLPGIGGKGADLRLHFLRGKHLRFLKQSWFSMLDILGSPV